MNEITMTLVRETDNDLQELIAKLDDYLSTLYPAEGIFGLDLTDPKVKETLFVVATMRADLSAVEYGRWMKRWLRSSGFVDIPYRNRGIASRILLYLEEQAKNRVIVFAPGNRRAAGGIRSFYKKLGYAQIEPFGEYIGSEYSLCFEKCLTSSGFVL